MKLLNNKSCFESHEQIRKTNVFLIAIGLTAMALFCVIAYFVAANDALPFDTTIRSAIYSLRNESFTNIITVITYIGNWQTVTFICTAALIYPHTRKTFGLPLTISAISSTVIYKLIKTLFARPRPDLSLRLIVQGGYSFPSGHAMTSLVFYGMLIYLCRKYIRNRRIKNTITVIIGLLIGMIGLSRIYLGVHFPTDVIAGWLLGTALLILFSYLLKLRT